MDIHKEAKAVLLGNYNATGGKYIPPALPHYPWQWCWDSSFHAIAASHLGMQDIAKNELVRLFKFQVKETGSIPHQIYGRGFNWTNWRDWIGWERFLYKGWMLPITPLAGAPVVAQAMRAINDRQFFLEYADSIVAFYRYFQNYRDPDNDGLISTISPREGGRDSSPEFDFLRLFRLPFSSKITESLLDAASLAFLEIRYKILGWKEKRVLALKAFDVQDLAFQCMWIDGLYDLEWMLKNWGGGVARYPEIHDVIAKAEKSVIEKCWNEEDGAFYSMKNGKEHLRHLTVSSLFPILIKNLPKEKKESIIDALTDKSKFGTPYPVPTVSISHPAFHPTRTWPIWRGPTWMNTNWFLIRGLVRNGHNEIAEKIIKSSQEMVEREGIWEFYNPFTGKGLRIKNFGWTTLVVTFHKYLL